VEQPSPTPVVKSGALVNLYVDLTPLEAAMVASTEKQIAALATAHEGGRVSSSGSPRWWAASQASASIDGLLSDRRRQVQMASARRRALNDVMDTLDLSERIIVLHESAEAARQTTVMLRGRWIEMAVDHPGLTPGVRETLHRDFETREITVLVIEAGNRMPPSLPPTDIIVVAGGWGLPLVWSALSTTLCQLCLAGTTVVTILVRRTAEEMVGSELAAHVGELASHHRWLAEGEAVIAIRSPSSYTPASAPGPQFRPTLDPLSFRDPLGELCPRCGTENEPGRWRCSNCYGRLDRARGSVTPP
jgi:hypothetical protein